MPISGLPKIGVQAVVEGQDSFNRAIDAVNKKIADVGKNTESAAGKVSPLNKAFDNAGKSIQSALTKFSDFAKTSLPFGDVIGGITDKLAALPLPVLAAAAAIVALGKAFIDLGVRGAPLIGLAESFDKLTASIGVSSKTLLTDLREASAGTVADFDLIKQANVALAGATGEFGKQFGQNLPKILEIARVQARATGQDVGFLYQSLITGIKRASPLLIDNTGITLKISQANKDYAESIGKTVEQMTDQDKQMAVLNATLTAGQLAIDTLGNSQETAAEKLSRVNATITNILDGFAVAVQPAFGTVLDGVQKVLNIFQQLSNAVAPIFGAILSVIANVFGTIISIVTSIVQPIVDVISSIAPYIALAFQFIANVIGGVGKIIGDIVGGIVRFLSDVTKNFFGLDLKNLGPQLFNGAAAAFGSFANGIISVANKLIFPAVIGIAKFIADFLIGFSPPKEGPLSVIDKGGENLMKAWLGGISGVSLDPVKQVAAEVSLALGDIGKLSLNTVNKRLATLDKALLPFQNRLDIVKASFEALNEPAKQALDAIDRETEKLQESVAQGDPAALERLRLLDMQRDAIQGQVDAQQGLLDRAQIQLGLAKAQQAPERALLLIRQAQLAASQQAAAKVTGDKSAAIPKEKVGTGAGITPPPAAGGGAAISAPGGAMPNVLDLIGGQGAVNDAAAGLSEAFMGAIDQTGLDEFAQNTFDLSGQLDRIKGADLGKTITDKFKGLTDAFNPDNPDSIVAKVQGFIGTLTGSAETPGSIASFFSDVPGNISSALSTLTADASTPGSVASFFAGIPAAIQLAIPAIAEGLQAALNLLFDPNTPGSPINAIFTTFTTLTGADEGSLAYMFGQIPANLSAAASGLLDSLKTNVFDPVTNFLIGSGEGTISDILNQFIALVATMPAGLVEALRNFGGMIYNAIVVPIINVMNAGIGAIESGIRNIAGFFAQFLAGIIGSFDTTEVAGTNLGGLVPQALRDFQAGLASVGSSFTIGRISAELPSFLQPPGGATGGLFSPGLMRVGERGEELMYNASKVGVIPNDLTRVLTDLSTILAQPQPMPIGGGSTTNNSNMNITMNGVTGANDAVRRFATMRARS